LAFTTGQADPFGGTAATLLTKTGTTTEGRMSLISALVSSVCPISLFIKQGTSATGYFGIFDNTTAAWRGQIVWTWTGGVPVLTPGTGGGLVGFVTALSGGWYRITGVILSIVSGNSNSMFISPVVGTPNTGTVYVIGAQEEDTGFGSQFATSYIKTSGAALGRATDTWTVPFTAAVQDMTIYSGFDTLFARNYAAQTLGAYPALWALGGAANTMRLYVAASNNPGQAGGLLVGSGLIGQFGVEQFVALPATGLCEFTIQYRAVDGAISVAVGTGAFNAFTPPTGTFGTAWPGATFGSNQASLTPNSAYRIRDILAVRGLRSYAEMVAVT
jgi:hypothetical protein